MNLSRENWECLWRHNADPTALLSFGVAGVLLGAVIGDVGLVMFLRGMGGRP